MQSQSVRCIRFGYLDSESVMIIPYSNRMTRTFINVSGISIL